MMHLLRSLLLAPLALGGLVVLAAVHWGRL